MVSPAIGCAIGLERTVVEVCDTDGSECVAGWFVGLPTGVLRPPAVNCAIGSDRTAVEGPGSHGHELTAGCA